jgi:hypothetical protein
MTAAAAAAAATAACLEMTMKKTIMSRTKGVGAPNK